MGVDQGGTSLPDRDYYVKDDAKNRETREQYVAHMTRMFALAGADNDVAAGNAKAVLALETKLAAAQLDRVGRRDPKNRDNKMTADALAAMIPSIDLKAYLASAEAPAFTEVNVGWPKFFKALNGIWAETSLDDLKTYARWRVLNASAPLLARKFEQENFAFFSTQLRGIKEQPPRWKTCVGAVDGNLGEALGQLYVEKAFGADSKARMKALVDALTVALGQDINQLDWMTAGDQGQGAGEAAAAEQEQDRLSRHVARLLQGHRLAHGLPGQQPPRESRRRAAGLRGAGQARGPDAVGHDAADRERVLLVAAGRDRLSRRHPAAAVLRSVGRRGRELRRHRRRHRPRADARLRRPGPQVRRQGQPHRLVDRGRRARPSSSAPPASRTSTRSTRR